MGGPERPTCQTCPHWLRDDEVVGDEDLGDCHRLPPSLPTAAYIGWDLGTGGAGFPFDGVFPSTTAADWCGEHPDFPDYIAQLKYAPEPRVTSDPVSLARWGGEPLQRKDWGARAWKYFQATGCATYGDVCRKTHEDVCSTHGSGVTTANAIQDALAAKGLSLADHRERRSVT